MNLTILFAKPEKERNNAEISNLNFITKGSIQVMKTNCIQENYSVSMTPQQSNINRVKQSDEHSTPIGVEPQQLQNSSINMGPFQQYSPAAIAEKAETNDLKLSCIRCVK